MLFFFVKQKTAYEMRISDWSSDVCSSDLRIVLDGLGDEGLVANRGGPSGDCRRIHVERAADAVQRIDNGHGRIDPADTKGGKAIGLREGTGHHHVTADRKSVV